MPHVVEDVPPQLQPAAEAALAWINQERGAQFKLTGLVDPEQALATNAGQPMELELVLCERDVCVREQVRIQAQGESFQISTIKAEDTLIPPHLDPPVGIRQSWLDEQLGRHAFIVLLFYRGLW
jgi:hypothetical protein